MIPIRNRKKTLQVTVDEMRNFAFAYVEKYAPSKQQLKTYLLKKYLKSSASSIKKQDINNLIDICAVYWHFLLVVWLVLFGLMLSS